MSTNHTQALAETTHTPQLPATERARLREAIEDSMSASTKRAYRIAWNAWAQWADRMGTDALPAAPQDIAAYLAHRAEAGAKTATLSMAVASVNAAHKVAGHAPPGQHPLVSTTLKGLKRQAAAAGSQPKQARALGMAELSAIRGAMADRLAAGDRRAIRDVALAATLADGGLRRSEAIALTWADITQEPDGSGRITIRHSKTDQEGEGAVIAVSAPAMRDINRLHGLIPRSPSDSVFGIAHGSTINRRIQAMAKAAGLGAGFSAHSGRVGMAQRMTAAGASTQTVARQGRWKSDAMVIKYTKAARAGEALNFL